MTLATTIANAVGTAFDAVAGLSTDTVVYRHHPSADADDSFASTFNPDTGGNWDLDPVDYTISKFVLTEYSRFEVAQGLAGPTDRKLMFPQSELAITPDTNGTILVNGEEYEVSEGKGQGKSVPIKADPANATWTIRIRKP